MSWVLIWICAQCSPDLEVVYTAMTEAEVRTVGSDLKRGGMPGQWMVARINADIQHGKMVVWNDETSEFSIDSSTGSEPYGDRLTVLRGRGLELGRERGGEAVASN